ncbi:hypothetical protein HPB48_022355 [Haemaphysalis longicornis]|uniref:RING-type domain-containing protein n=1 Tax=Haemaphysalis longicornis TaxID=44386 RepID=A0A9J6FNN0_HAELO|nr:hypothetical protein HPB48_022355 [Haemaphysalis longicornis]
MAAGGVKCTVFGFDCFLDWRPTIFLNAFPPTRVCSVCDLVPHAVGLLPCHHVLCPRCYNKCCEGRRCKCPLDKAVHEQQDLVWSMFTQESILERKVGCNTFELSALKNLRPRHRLGAKTQLAQFLNLSLRFKRSPVDWCYELRSTKHLLILGWLTLKL